MKISFIGAGSWGTALAISCAEKGHEVLLYSHNKEKLEILKTKRVHPSLKGAVIPVDLRYTSSLEEAADFSSIIVIAVASTYVRSTAEKLAPYLNKEKILVSLAKGIEKDSLLTMTEVIAEVLKKNRKEVKALVALDGPSHAEEVALNMPTTLVSASSDIRAAEFIQNVFSSAYLRIYTNDDIKGVEICGAVKNILAICSGLSLGLGYGDNAKAALITRGIAELARLGRALNCKEETFMGLAGVGDIIVTSTSFHSRNLRFGYLLGQGKTVEEAKKEIGQVVEGLNALDAVVQLKNRYQVLMPLVDITDAIIKGKIKPEEALKYLFGRELKSELE